MTNVSERNPISQTWSWASRNYRTKASGERKTIAGLTFFNPSFFLSSLLTFLILHSKFEFVMFSSLPGDIEHWKNWCTSYIVHAKYAEAKAICTLATIFQLLFFTISDYEMWPYVLYYCTSICIYHFSRFSLSHISQSADSELISFGALSVVKLWPSSPPTNWASCTLAFTAFSLSFLLHSAPPHKLTLKNENCAIWQPRKQGRDCPHFCSLGWRQRTCIRWNDKGKKEGRSTILPCQICTRTRI